MMWSRIQAQLTVDGLTPEIVREVREALWSDTGRSQVRMNARVGVFVLRGDSPIVHGPFVDDRRIVERDAEIAVLAAIRRHQVDCRNVDCATCRAWSTQPRSF